MKVLFYPIHPHPPIFRKGISFEGLQASPVCHSTKSSVQTKLSMEQWWSDTDRGRPNLKTKINPNYVQSSSSYRTVNTLPLYCKETATQYCVAATNKMGHARLIRLFYLCNTTRHLISETRNKNTDSPWFATIHSTYGCDHGSPPPPPKKL